jgi:hypothetical protein
MDTYKKIRSRISAAISSSEGESAYVLEDVFWVPAHNCCSVRSASSHEPEFRAEEPDTGEAANSGDIELGSANNIRKS